MLWKIPRWLLRKITEPPGCDFCNQAAKYSDGVGMLACEEHAHLFDGEDRRKGKSMTFEEFARANRERCQSPQGFNQPDLNDWSRNDWLVAVIGEIGEACNVSKKLKRSEGDFNKNKETDADLNAKFRQEIGDAGVYLDLICQAHGFTLEQAMVEVFNAKSAEIGYPVQLTN